MAFKDFDITKVLEAENALPPSSLGTHFESARMTGMVDVTGIDETKENIARLLATMLKASSGGSRRVAEKILFKAKQFVPYDTGALFRTGRIVTETWAVSGLRGPSIRDEYLITFGDTESGVDYATLVHENPMGHEFNPYPPQAPAEYSGEPRVSHYLVHAQEYYRDKITPGIANFVHDAANAYMAALQAELAAKRASAMRPRLVRK